MTIAFENQFGRLMKYPLFHYMKNKTAKIIGLAILYVLTGKLGLSLALPPGYATLIWPPSGIALGALLLYGRRIWPGILIGSFILNCYISDAFRFGSGFDVAKTGAAFLIATGSTLQAIGGRLLVKRYVGLPLSLNTVKDVLSLFAVAAPVACLTAATIGEGTLFALGIISSNDILAHWVTWWSGDVFGVIVFLPLTFISPFSANRLCWRGKKVDTLPILAMFAVIVPLGLTFYAWKITSENIYNQNIKEFEALALESEKAMMSKIDSYKFALLGGAGFFNGSDFVSRDEWHTYIDNIDIKKNFPGMRGMGLALSVKPKEIPSFVKKVRKDGPPDFKIHPETKGRPYNVIVYLEPLEDNKPAIGLNLAFEDNRLNALNWARDTGKAVMTEKIVLLQATTDTPGFLLVHPLYKKNALLNKVKDRRQANVAWIYAPFVAKDFLSGLTKSQTYSLNVRIYDKGTEAPENLIFKSDTSQGKISAPEFTVHKKLDIMQREWLVIWESTAEYHRMKGSSSPFFILIGGLVFTALFSLFILLVVIRRTDAEQWVAEEKSFLLPITAFLLTMVASFYLYKSLKLREFQFVKASIEQESKKIVDLITVQTNEKFLAMTRMAQRWNSANGTPYNQWLDDAKNYTNQLAGLKTVEWVDSTNHVRWIQPMKGNEKLLGLNILFDDDRKAALKGAVQKRTLTITPPFDLMQGYRGFLVCVPLVVKGSHDGFIVGVFSADELISDVVRDEILDKYEIAVLYKDQPIFKSGSADADLGKKWKIDRTAQVYDKIWTIRITPTKKFVKEQLTSLPLIVLTAGFVISFLLALTIRYVLISRVKSRYLYSREEQMRLLVKNTPAAVAMFDRDLKYIMTSERWLEDYNLVGESIVGKSHYDIFPEFLNMPHWPYIHQRAMKGEVFDTHEECWVRPDGKEEWVKWAIHPWVDTKGKIGGIVMFTEVITARKIAESALEVSEETFRSAMEYASIGMALVALNGTWLEVNQALCLLLGFTKEQLLATNFQSLTHPDDLDEDMQYAERLLDGSLSSYQMEKRYFHKNGNIIWVLLSVSLVFKGSGAPKYFISQIQDITQQKEMDRIKSEFISIVSHELRTPLTSIRGSLGLIVGTMTKSLPEKVNRLIQIAHENSERLIFLINDILDIDKIASGQMRFDMKEEELAPLLQKTADANSAYADKFNVTINYIPAEGGMKIKIDAARLIQVLSNLLSNAAKFSPEGEIIELFTSRIENKIRISVKDRGPGIPEEFRTRIFGKFSQADSSVTRTKGGTGLGLNISKEIVERMSGRIGFDTESGEGATFWIEFPDMSEAHFIAEKTDLIQLSHVKSQNLPRILHVEDDKGLINFFTDALQDKAKIVPAYTLMQAKEKLEQEEFTLIILDIGLPDGSGMDLLNYLYNTKHKNVPVVVLSAVEASEQIKDKVSAYIVKSRMSETRIIEEMLDIISKNQKEANHG